MGAIRRPVKTILLLCVATTVVPRYKNPRCKNTLAVRILFLCMEKFWLGSRLFDNPPAARIPRYKNVFSWIEGILITGDHRMWRRRSVIGCLQHRDIRLKSNSWGVLEGIMIHARTPKEQQIKTAQVGTIQNAELCPVKTTAHFLEMMEDLRINLPADHTLFLTYLGDKKKVASIRPATVARMAKEAMMAARIDTTQFTAHSIRAASSTKAVQLGHPTDQVKHHAIGV